MLFKLPLLSSNESSMPFVIPIDAWNRFFGSRNMNEVNSSWFAKYYQIKIDIGKRSSPNMVNFINVTLRGKFNDIRRAAAKIVNVILYDLPPQFVTRYSVYYPVTDIQVAYLYNDQLMEKMDILFKCVCNVLVIEKSKETVYYVSIYGKIDRLLQATLHLRDALAYYDRYEKRVKEEERIERNCLKTIEKQRKRAEKDARRCNSKVYKICKKAALFFS
ncbi:unnamed protein product [Caenorhabditis bovis]|uniref:Uncharacterized protein n=1 Tax=Caenorhabditis bovis TaxID=2654633 RepID=A0A8S1FE12_9PELO|nr:unnamed protein product [Caenorhabditis bovis]